MLFLAVIFKWWHWYCYQRC